ncbi:amidohydrolase family protein [Chloroflexota bacterium]
MMIIDANTHMFHSSLIEQLNSIGGTWAKKKAATEQKALAQGNPYRTDVAQRVAQLDRNHIDFQVVTPGNILYINLIPDDPAKQLTLAQIINNGMARLMEESKGRLIGVGAVPMTEFEQNGIREMERAIKTLGLKGITVPSNFKGRPLHIKELEPLWSQAEAMNVPIYIHPNYPVRTKDRGYEADYNMKHNFGYPFETELALSELVFSGVMERYPALKIISHHLGGGIPFFLGRTNETYEPSAQQRRIGRVMPKPLYDYFSLFYYDTAVGGSAPATRCAYEVFGADKLIFASDAPNGPQHGEYRLANYPKVIKSLNLSEHETNKILANNARKILNL